MSIGLVVVIVIAFFVGWLTVTYNGLVHTRNKVDEGWSGIDVQLKRRHDLIPNLVNTVKGYAEHEKSTLEATVTARSRAEQALAEGPGAAARAEDQLTDALTGLLAVAEAYPQLKASENFVELQRQLAETEDQIAAARRIYNGNVQTYNTKIQIFPNNIFAGPFGFRSRDMFEISDSGERGAVAVKI